MRRRDPPKINSLDTLYEAVVTLCRHVAAVERDVKQIHQRLQITKIDTLGFDWQFDDEANDEEPREVATTFKHIASLINEAETHIEDMGYDIRSIRSKLDKILEGDYTRDEMVQMLGLIKKKN